MSAAGARRVVVTGVGLVTPIGLDEATVWSNLVAGRTGIREIVGFDASDNEVALGAEIDLEDLDALQQGKLRRADRTVRFAVEAARQALQQAGLQSEPPFSSQEVASIWGTGCGPSRAIFDGHRRFADKGPKGLRPSTVPKTMANAISAEVSLAYQLVGTNQVIVSACTSSTNAIGQGFRMIRHGDADAVLCGGSEAPFDPYHYGVWNNLGVFSKIPEPDRALRPFDADRDGMLLGEGAGALLLESLDSAERRGVRPRGEILGYGESSDAANITNPSAAGQARAIRSALSDANVPADAIGYINAHGTGTAANDVTETRSIREAMGAAGGSIPVGASKSFFGHTLGASGAIESIATLLALEAGVLPPNLNLDRQDPECELSLLGSEPTETDAELAMKNSFGFGGGNGVLVFRGSRDRV